jgi:DNA-binding CsgD family transcriptional regulator
VARDGADAATWAARAALVLLGRGRPDRALEWLDRGARAGGADELLDHARARLQALVDGLPPGRAHDTPEPPALAAAAAVFSRTRRLAQHLHGLSTVVAPSAQQTALLRDVLAGARDCRAVLLWCHAAQLARAWHVRPGPGPTGPDGTDDVGAAVVSLLAVGCTTADCAAALGLSPRAVEKRITALYRATGCTSRTQLVRAYLDGGLLMP